MFSKESVNQKQLRTLARMYKLTKDKKYLVKHSSLKNEVDGTLPRKQELLDVLESISNGEFSSSDDMNQSMLDTSIANSLYEYYVDLLGDDEPVFSSGKIGNIDDGFAANIIPDDEVAQEIFRDAVDLNKEYFSKDLLKVTSKSKHALGHIRNVLLNAYVRLYIDFAMQNPVALFLNFDAEVPMSSMVKFAAKKGSGDLEEEVVDNAYTAILSNGNPTIRDFVLALRLRAAEAIANLNADKNGIYNEMHTNIQEMTTDEDGKVFKKTIKRTGLSPSHIRFIKRIHNAYTINADFLEQLDVALTEYLARNPSKKAITVNGVPLMPNMTVSSFLSAAAGPSEGKKSILSSMTAIIHQAFIQLRKRGGEKFTYGTVGWDPGASRNEGDFVLGVIQSHIDTGESYAKHFDVDSDEYKLRQATQYLFTIEKAFEQRSVEPPKKASLMNDKFIVMNTKHLYSQIASGAKLEDGVSVKTESISDVVDFIHEEIYAAVAAAGLAAARVVKSELSGKSHKEIYDTIDTVFKEKLNSAINTLSNQLPQNAEKKLLATTDNKQVSWDSSAIKGSIEGTINKIAFTEFPMPISSGSSFDTISSLDFLVSVGGTKVKPTKELVDNILLSRFYHPEGNDAKDQVGGGAVKSFYRSTTQTFSNFANNKQGPGSFSESYGLAKQSAKEGDLPSDILKQALIQRSSVRNRNKLIKNGALARPTFALALKVLDSKRKSDEGFALKDPDFFDRLLSQKDSLSALLEKSLSNNWEALQNKEAIKVSKTKISLLNNVASGKLPLPKDKVKIAAESISEKINEFNSSKPALEYSAYGNEVPDFDAILKAFGYSDGDLYVDSFAAIRKVAKQRYSGVNSKLQKEFSKHNSDIQKGKKKSTDKFRPETDLTNINMYYFVSQTFGLSEAASGTKDDVGSGIIALIRSEIQKEIEVKNKEISTLGAISNELKAEVVNFTLTDGETVIQVKLSDDNSVGEAILDFQDNTASYLVKNTDEVDESILNSENGSYKAMANFLNSEDNINRATEEQFAALINYDISNALGIAKLDNIDDINEENFKDVEQSILENLSPSETSIQNSIGTTLGGSKPKDFGLDKGVSLVEHDESEAFVGINIDFDLTDKNDPSYKLVGSGYLKGPETSILSTAMAERMGGLQIQKDLGSEMFAKQYEKNAVVVDEWKRLHGNIIKGDDEDLSFYKSKVKEFAESIKSDDTLYKVLSSDPFNLPRSDGIDIRNMGLESQDKDEQDIHRSEVDNIFGEFGIFLAEKISDDMSRPLKKLVDLFVMNEDKTGGNLGFSDPEVAASVKADAILLVIGESLATMDSDNLIIDMARQFSGAGFRGESGIMLENMSRDEILESKPGQAARSFIDDNFTSEVTYDKNGSIHAYTSAGFAKDIIRFVSSAKSFESDSDSEMFKKFEHYSGPMLRYLNAETPPSAQEIGAFMRGMLSMRAKHSYGKFLDNQGRGLINLIISQNTKFNGKPIENIYDVMEASGCFLDPSFVAKGTTGHLTPSQSSDVFTAVDSMNRAQGKIYSAGIESGREALAALTEHFNYIRETITNQTPGLAKFIVPFKASDPSTHKYTNDDILEIKKIATGTEKMDFSFVGEKSTSDEEIDLAEFYVESVGELASFLLSKDVVKHAPSLGDRFVQAALFTAIDSNKDIKNSEQISEEIISQKIDTYIAASIAYLEKEDVSNADYLIDSLKLDLLKLKVSFSNSRASEASKAMYDSNKVSASKKRMVTRTRLSSLLDMDVPEGFSKTYTMSALNAMSQKIELAMDGIDEPIVKAEMFESVYLPSVAKAFIKAYEKRTQSSFGEVFLGKIEYDEGNKGEVAAQIIIDDVNSDREYYKDQVGEDLIKYSGLGKSELIDSNKDKGNGTKTVVRRRRKKEEQDVAIDKSTLDNYLDASLVRFKIALSAEISEIFKDSDSFNKLLDKSIEIEESIEKISEISYEDYAQKVYDMSYEFEGLALLGPEEFKEIEEDDSNAEDVIHLDEDDIEILDDAIDIEDNEHELIEEDNTYTIDFSDENASLTQIPTLQTEYESPDIMAGAQEAANKIADKVEDAEFLQEIKGNFNESGLINNMTIVSNILGDISGLDPASIDNQDAYAKVFDIVFAYSKDDYTKEDLASLFSQNKIKRMYNTLVIDLGISLAEAIGNLVPENIYNLAPEENVVEEVALVEEAVSSAEKIAQMIFNNLSNNDYVMELFDAVDDNDLSKQLVDNMATVGNVFARIALLPEEKVSGVDSRAIHFFERAAGTYIEHTNFSDYKNLMKIFTNSYGEQLLERAQKDFGFSEDDLIAEGPEPDYDLDEDVFDVEEEDEYIADKVIEPAGASKDFRNKINKLLDVSKEMRDAASKSSKESVRSMANAYVTGVANLIVETATSDPTRELEQFVSDQTRLLSLATKQLLESPNDEAVEQLLLNREALMRWQAKAQSFIQ